MNCLTQAISAERIHQVRLLLSMNVDCTTRDRQDYNRTPLMKCCQVDSEDAALKLMKILMRFQVNLNERDNLGRAALHYVCATGKAKVANILMNEDAVELNCQDNEGKTPLMLACIGGHHALVMSLLRKLIKFDLDVNVRDADGYTALLFAIKHNHYDVAHDLIKFANACTTIQDNEFHKTANEWLKTNLDSRKKNRKNLKTARRKQTKSKPRSSNKENVEGQARTPPALEEERNRPSTVGAKNREISSANLSEGSLFGSDPYGSFVRPISSFSKASSKGRFSASSRKTATKPLTHIGEDDKSSLKPPGLKPDDISLLKSSENYSVVSYGTARSRIGEDLESITEYPYQEETSESPLREEFQTVKRSESRKSGRTKDTSLLPASGGKQEKVGKPVGDVYAIQKLKQALRANDRRKLTRVGTAQFRPISGTPSEQWMPTILSHNHIKERSTIGSKNSPSRKSESPKTARGVQSTTPPVEESLPMESSFSQASSYTLTDTTAIAYKGSFKTGDNKAANHMEILFKLYADSCLWKPKTPKSSSLSVKPPTEGLERVTVESEASGSVVLDLGADDIVPSRPKKGKSRLTSATVSSATSRTSRIGTASRKKD